jgi:hypothetical protein
MIISNITKTEKDPCINCIVRVTCPGSKHYGVTSLYFSNRIWSKLCPKKKALLRNRVEIERHRQEYTKTILRIVELFRMIVFICICVTLVIKGFFMNLVETEASILISIGLATTIITITVELFLKKIYK